MSQTNFPVLFTTIDAQFKSLTYGGFVRSELGYDLRPYADKARKQPLPFQLRRYDPATGEVAMVILTQPSSAADTKIQLACGGSFFADGSSPAVWDENFKAVYDLPSPATLAVGMGAITRFSGNPIIGRGWGTPPVIQPNEMMPIVNPLDATQLIAFFSGFTDLTPPGVCHIYYATSPVSDGYTWTIGNALAPIIAGGLHRLDAVVVDGTNIKLYSSNGGGSNSLDCYEQTFTGLAGLTSWTLHASVITPLADESGFMGTTPVMRDDDGVYYAFICSRDSTFSVSRVRVAISSDGIVWTRAAPQADILTQGAAGSYDATYFEGGQAFKLNGVYLLFLSVFQGKAYAPADGATWTSALYYSDNPLSGWQRTGANPVFTGSLVTGSVDKYHVSTSYFFKLGNSWKIFYQGNPTDPVIDSSLNGPWSLCMAELPAGRSPLDACVMALKDATVNGNDLFATGGIVRDPTGVVLNAKNLPFLGAALVPLPLVDTFSVTMKVRPKGSQLSAFMMSGSPFTFTTLGANAYNGFALGMGNATGTSAGRRLLFIVSGVAFVDSGGDLIDGDNIVQVICNNGVTNWFINGVQTPVHNYSANAPIAPTLPLKLGSWGMGISGEQRNFDGSIAITRISDAARTDSWRATEFNNLGKPNDFIWYPHAAATYYNTGPASGDNGVVSAPFTVRLPRGGIVDGTVTITPNDSGAGGTFTPATVQLSTAVPSATFTYTPANAGAKTINTTNDKGLINPRGIAYSVRLADGEGIAVWRDSSASGNDATEMTSVHRPIFKKNIVNGAHPVVRFVAANQSKLSLTVPLAGAPPWTIFAVAKKAALGKVLYCLAGDQAGPFMLLNSDENYYFGDNTTVRYTGPFPVDNFHVITINMAGGGIGQLWIDGTLSATLTSALANTGSFNRIGWRALTPDYSDGDIADLLYYSGTLAAARASDRANVEAYLGQANGITVAGGTPVDPRTVTGLKGWWSASALLT